MWGRADSMQGVDAGGGREGCYLLSKIRCVRVEMKGCGDSHGVKLQESSLHFTNGRLGGGVHNWPLSLTVGT